VSKSGTSFKIDEKTSAAPGTCTSS
jgi:hypothetical protein